MRRLICLMLIACGHATPLHAVDFAEARRSFHTRLVREGPSPQAAEAIAVAADAHEVPYTSGGLQLRAWVSNTPGGAPRPAVVYVHGASAFRADHREATRPLRDAGFIVMTPILRGETRWSTEEYLVRLPSDFREAICKYRFSVEFLKSRRTPTYLPA